MKKVKLLKGLILGAIVSLIGILISLGTSKGIEVYADPAAGHVELSYEVYTLDDYLILNSFEDTYGVDIETAKAELEIYDSIYQEAIDDGEDPSDAADSADSYWNGSMMTNISNGLPDYTSNTTYPSGGSYPTGWWSTKYAPSGTYAGGTVKYMIPNTAGTKYKTGYATVAAGAGFTVAQIQAAVAEYEAVESITSVNENDYIVIVVKMNTGDEEVSTIRLPYDLTGLSAVSKNPSTGYAGKYQEGITDDIKNGTNGDNYIYGLPNQDSSFCANSGFSDSTNSNYPTLDIMRPNGDDNMTGEFVVGTFATKVGSGSSFTIQYLSTATISPDDNKAYVTDPELNQLVIDDSGLELTIESSSSDTAEISKVKFNGVDYTTTTSVTLNGTAYDTFVMPKSTVTTTSVSAAITTNKNGTLGAGQVNLVSTDDNTATMSSMSISGSANPYTISVTPTTWETGESIYAKVTVYATDYDATDSTLSTHKKDYLIQFEKDKYTTKELSGLTFNSDGVRPTETSPYAVLYNSSNGATATFASGTSNYYLRVANNTTQVQFTPTWDQTKKMKVEYSLDNTTFTTIAYTTGSTPTAPTFTIPFASGNTQDVYIKVTAQDDNSKTYKVTLYRLDNNTDLAATPFVVRNNDGNPATISGSGTAYSADVDYGSTTYTAAATLKYPTKQKLEYSTSTLAQVTGGTATWTAINSGVETPAAGFATGTASNTKTVFFRVTAEDGKTTKVYKLDAVRNGGKKESILPNPISIKYDGGLASTIIMSTTADPTDPTYKETGTATINDIAWKTKGAQLQITCDTTKGQTISYKYKVSSGSFSSPANSNSGVWIPIMYFDGATSAAGNYGVTTATSLIIEVTVKAQDTTYESVYTIEINRKAASTDVDLDGLNVYLTEPSAANFDLTSALSYDATTKTYSTTTNVDFKYDGVKVEPTFDTLASATVGTPTITAVAIANGALSNQFPFTVKTEQTLTITLIIKAEDNSTETYTIKVTRNAAEDDKDVYISVVAEDGTPITLGAPVVSGSKYTYTATGDPLDFTNRYVEIALKMTNDTTSRSKIKADLKDINGNTTATAQEVHDNVARNYYIDYNTSPITVATTATFTFKLYTEKDSTTGYTIEIKVSRKAADSDATITTPTFTGVDDSQVYAYDSYNATTRTYNYIMTKSTSGTTYILDTDVNKNTSKIYYSYAVPTPSSTVKLYDTGFAAQYGTLYDPASTDPADHTFSAGSTGQVLYLTVIPQSGQVKTYAFNVTYKDERQAGHAITDISVTFADPTKVISSTYSFTRVSSTDDISSITQPLGSIKVPYSVSSVTISVTFDSTTSDLATLNTGTGLSAQGSIPLVEGPNSFKYQARAENTTVGCFYTFDITRESAKTDNLLEKLTIGGTTLVDMADTSKTFNGRSIVYTALPRTTNFVYVNFVVSDYAKYIISDGSSVNQSGTQTTSGANNQVYLSGLSPNNKYTLNLTIQSEKEVFDSASTFNPITIEIYTAEQEFTIDNIELFQDMSEAALTEDKNGNNFVYAAATNNYPTMELYYKNNDKAYAKVTLNNNSKNAVVTTDGEKSLASGLNTYTIVIKSEYAALNPLITNQTNTYVIKLKKDAPSNDAFLTNLVLENQMDLSPITLNTAFNTNDTGPYIAENIPTNSNSKAIVKFIPTLSDSNATYTISSAVNDIVTLDGSLSTGAVTTTVSIEVTPEDPSAAKRTYYVTISTGQVVLNKDNSIANIIVNADNDSSHNLISYSSGNPTYSPTTRPSVNSVNITVTVNDSKASIYQTTDGSSETEVKGTADTQTTKTFNVVLNKASGGSAGTTVVEIISRAQDTTVADKKYTITIKSSTPDQDRSFDTYKIEIFDDTGVLKSTYNYSASDTNPVIYVKNDHEKAKLTVLLHSQFSTVTPSDTGNTRAYTTNKNLVVDTNSISFVVKSEDSVTEPYNITIIRDDVTTLSNLEITEQGDTTNLVTGFPTSDNKYSFEVAYSVDKLDFAYTLNALSASNVTVTSKVGSTNITGSTINLSVGLNTFVLTVKPKSGDSRDYTVSITRKNGNDENYIITFKHDATQAELHKYDTTIPNVGTVLRSDKTIVYILDRNYNNTNFDPVLTVSSTAKDYNGKPYKIVQTNTLLSVGTNNFTIIVTSETNKDNEYNFTVYVADTSATVSIMKLYETGKTTNLVDVNNDVLDYDKDTPEYSLTYKYSQKTADLFLELESSYANVKLNGTGIGKLTNPLQYLSNLNIDNSMANAYSHQITFNVTIEAEILSYYNISDAAEKAKYTNTFKIVITKEDPNTDTTLYTLTVQAGTKTYNIITAGVENTTDQDINIAGTEYTLENAGSAQSFTVSAKANKLPTLTSFEQLTYNSSTQLATKTITFAAAGDTSQSHIFYVYNEAHDDYTEYTIIIYRAEAIDPDTNNDITMIDLIDSLNVSYIDNSVFNPNDTTYTFGTNGISTISYGLNKSYTISVSIPSGSNATVYIDGAAKTNKQSGAISITYPATGNYSKTHTVYAMSQSGSKGTVYTINVIAVRADSDAFLTNLLVDGSQVVDKNGVRFTKNNFSYDLGTYDNEYFETSIHAQLSNPLAKAQIISSKGESFTGYDASNIALNLGSNTISIIVTAEDGSTTNTYQVIIFRDYEDPLLTDLEVVGEKLLNSTYKDVVKFDSETKHYYVKLLYGTTSFTVNASLSADSQSYSVVPSGLTIVSNTGITRIFTSKPSEGINNYTITVRSPQGKTNKYYLTVKLNDSGTASTNISAINPTSRTYDLINVVSTPTGNIDPTLSGINTLPRVDIYNDDGTLKEFKYLSSIVDDYSNGDLVQNYGTYVVANKVRTLDSSVLNIAAEKVKDEDGNGAQIKFVSGTDLNVGNNQVVIQVVSEDGNNIRTVILDVVRLDNEYTLSSDEISQLKNDFANDRVNADGAYVVDSTVTDLTFRVANADTSDTVQPTVTVLYPEKLQSGNNKVKVLITPADGGTPLEQEIDVYRSPYNFEVSAEQITDVKQNYADGELNGKAYTVSSKISKLDLSVINLDNKSDDQKPTYTITNDGQLKVGENEVTLTIEAPDGTRTFNTFKVTRSPMEFEVDKLAYNYACEQVSGKPNYYKINLVKATASVITDYTTYIKYDAETNDLVVEDLTGEKTADTSEVLLRVSTKDGAESEIVHLQLESASIGTKGSVFDIIFWIILILAIILLIIILICVNRDKYGSISKKRKA